MATLLFKFRSDASPELRSGILAALGEDAGAEVRPLFPEEGEPELAALYLAAVRGSSTGRRVRRMLGDSGAVEFVEDVPERKLVV